MLQMFFPLNADKFPREANVSATIFCTVKYTRIPEHAEFYHAPQRDRIHVPVLGLVRGYLATSDSTPSRDQSAAGVSVQPNN
jgi:hypothetical protein